MSLRLPPVWIRVALSVVVLTLLWRVVDGARVLDLLRTAEPAWLAAGGILLILQTVIAAMRWRLTAGALGQQIGRGRAVAEYLLAQFLNQVLPGGVIGDAGRALRGRGAAGLKVAAQAVALERLSGQIALYAVLIPALVLAVLVPGGLGWPGQVADAALALLALGAAVAIAALIAARGRVRRIVQGLQTAGARVLLARDMWPRQAVLSLLTVVCNLGAFACAARATGTSMPLTAIPVLVPLILTAMMIPAFVGGWGPREGAAGLLWPLIGAPTEAGIAASIAFGLMFLAASLPGIGVLMLDRKGDPRTAENRKPALSPLPSGQEPLG